MADTRKYSQGEGSYFKVQDVEMGPIVVTIVDSAEGEAFGKKSLVLSFSDNPAKLRLNPTRTKDMQRLYGFDDEGWVGKLIELYQGEYPWNGEVRDTVAIRVPSEPEAKAPSPAPEAAEKAIGECSQHVGWRNGSLRCALFPPTNILPAIPYNNSDTPSTAT